MGEWGEDTASISITRYCNVHTESTVMIPDQYFMLIIDL